MTNKSTVKYQYNYEIEDICYWQKYVTIAKHVRRFLSYTHT